MKITRKLLPLVAAALMASCSQSDKNASFADINLDKDWQFMRSSQALDLSDAQHASNWEAVSIPHAPEILPLVIKDQFQGDAWYKKTLTPDPSWKGKQISITFEAAMNGAEVWLNGEKLGSHLGGYLPFTLVLSDKLKWNAPNELLVRLDNRDNPVTGPKPLKDLDFNTYGGIYRHVTLHIDNELHITDPIAANSRASGGIFVTYPQVSKDQATLDIQTQVYNADIDPKAFQVVQRLMNGDQVVVDQTGDMQHLNGQSAAESHIELVLPQPKLWSPKSPQLYTLVTRVYDGNTLVDEQSTRLGIREFKLVNGELFINGEKTFLRGVNRHQEYPYVGYATSDAADYRDAVRIKSAGFDYVRLSHYPQSEAFMAAADELGLVLLDSVLGWQYFSEDPAFQTQIQQTCRDLIRRDRNHASVLAWECSLNESWMSEAFIDSLTKIVHEEYPGPNTYSAGWQEYGYDIYLQARQHRLEHYTPPTKPYIVSEYGDWEYYAMNAGLNQGAWGDLLQADRSSRQLLGDGEKRLLQQATNIQEAHNDNRRTPAFADGYWVMFDYNRGYSPDLESSGIMSIDRLPKFSYYLFQSQRDAQERSSAYSAGPMVKIASYWQPDSSLNIRVFSNAEQVELLLNGKSLGKQRPDQNTLSDHLNHPPFSFQIPEFEAGELKAVAFIGDKLVAEDTVITPGAPAGLRLSLDTQGIAPQAGVKDLVFVRAQLVDSAGNPLHTKGDKIRFSLSGDGQLISPAELETSDGQAVALVQVGSDLSSLSLSAQQGDLRSSPLKFQN